MKVKLRFSAPSAGVVEIADVIKSATPCHDAQVAGLYRDSNPLCLTIMAAASEDYTTAPQHLLSKVGINFIVDVIPPFYSVTQASLMINKSFFIVTRWTGQDGHLVIALQLFIATGYIYTNICFLF